MNVHPLRENDLARGVQPTAASIVGNLWPRRRTTSLPPSLRSLLWLVVGCCLVMLAGYFGTGSAHAELACPIGTEQSGGLCYPPCQTGFYGDGPVCFSYCPQGYTDDGALCRKDAHIFAKQSYGRGGGIGMVCAANQEGQGGLCYPRCQAGYYGVGPVCWQRCRAGYADHGASCYRNIFDWHFKNTYGRGAGGPVTACPAGTVRSGALCYPPCAAGFVGNGPVCFSVCPQGYTDDGALCRKDAHIFAKQSYGRGAGEVMNTIPVALDATIRTAKDTPVAFAYEHEDFDGSGELPVTLVQNPSHGNINEGVYTPNPGFVGTDRILWKTTDGKNESNVAIITFLVGDVGENAAPVAVDRTVALNEETPLTLAVTCTDADNDELLYQLLEKPKFGEYKWLAPNQVIYTPTVDFVGADYFTFRSHDGIDASNVSTITLEVAAVNDAPVAAAQQVTVTRNSSVAAVLAATDAEGEPISYTVVASPTHGVLSGAAPELVYTPDRNFTGADSIQFQAFDPHGAATLGTLAILVLPGNAAPLAAARSFTTVEQQAVAITLDAVDTDGDDLTYTLLTTPTHGTVDGAGANWVYLPEPGFTGMDSFSYQASDGLTSSAATVTIEVSAAPNQASVAGIVYEDGNGNDLPDEGDRGVGALIVRLNRADTQVNGAAVTFVTRTDERGLWRIDDVPFGQYVLRIESAPGIQLAAPVETHASISQRGLVQVTPIDAVVSVRSVFLPVLER